MFHSIKNLLKWVFRSLVTKRETDDSNLILLRVCPVWVVWVVKGSLLTFLHFWELSPPCSWLYFLNLLWFLNLIYFLFKNHCQNQEFRHVDSDLLFEYYMKMYLLLKVQKPVLNSIASECLFYPYKMPILTVEFIEMSRPESI